MNVRRSLLALLLLLPPAVAAAATPRDEALRLVPDDVGFCLVVSDLRDHADALAGSPFLEQFRASPLWLAVLASAETTKLLAVEKQFRKDLGIDWARLRDDVFGDAIVVAYRPGPAGQMSKQDQDLIVIRARDAKVLAELLERVNQVQRERKEVTELEPRTYQGQTYYRRVDRGHENFYYRRGPVLALSGKEAMLQRVIDLDRQAGTAEPSVARQLRLLGADRRLVALWINPRAFEAEIERKAAASKEQEATVTRAFLAYWKSLDGVALSFDLGRDAEVALAVRANVERLPPGARRFFAGLARPSELWQRFPDGALLTIVGRFDAPALAEMLDAFLTTEERQGLWQALQGGLGAVIDKDVVKDVLPNVGPDWGLCVAAPPAGERAWFPQILFAVRVRPGDGGVDQALFSALKSFAVLGVIDHNQKNKDQTSLKTVQQEQVEVKYLANEMFPPGCNPAFALKAGYLVFASSPDVIRRFGAAQAPAPNAEEFPLLRLSLKALRQYVQERREPLARASAEKHQISPAEAEQRLSGLLLGLQFFERIEVSQRPGPGQVTLTLRLQPARPFSGGSENRASPAGGSPNRR
jgi:hypothetical protein